MPVAGIPLSASRVPDGKIGVTLDIVNVDPPSVVLTVGDLEKLVSGVDQVNRQVFGLRHAEVTHVRVATVR